MKIFNSIRFKAFFLLLVFISNTFIGLACTLGLNSVFQSNHHQKNTNAAVHIHKDGKRHDHSKSEKRHNSHEININKKSQSEDSKDECCNRKIQQLQSLEKFVPDNINISHPVFFTAFAISYFNIVKPTYKDIVKNRWWSVRNYHPPIPDIRIAIQSFQI